MLSRLIQWLSLRLGSTPTLPPQVEAQPQSPWGHTLPQKLAYAKLSTFWEHRHDIANAMRQVPPNAWPRIQDGYREISLNPSDIASLTRADPDLAVELLGVASLNWNGYTREAAVRALGELSHPRRVPYLLMRLGDWVSEVRIAAERALQRCLDQPIVLPFVEHHRLVEHLRRVGRVNLIATVDRIEDHLRQPVFRPRLLAQLDFAEDLKRRYIYNLLKSELLDSPTLLERAARDRSPSVRAWVASELARARRPEYEPILKRLLQDRAPSVVLAGLLWLAEPLPQAITAIIEAQLTSRSSGVREAAQFLLKRRGATDLADRYRAQLAAADGNANARAGAIAGLGQTGIAADFERVAGHFASPRANERAATVCAAAALNFAAAKDRIILALSDSSSLVRQAAVAALRPRLDDEIKARVRPLVRTGNDREQWVAFSLLTTRRDWDSFADTLYGLIAHSGKVRKCAQSHLSTYDRRLKIRGWVVPSAQAKVDIAAAYQTLDAATPLLPPSHEACCRSIRQWLGPLIVSTPDP